MTAKKMRGRIILQRRFIYVWSKASNAREVAEKFGVTIRTAQNFAKSLREAGEQLKVFKRGRPSRLEKKEQ